MIKSFLDVKYPYNQISCANSTWINHTDLWRTIKGMEKLNNTTIDEIKKTDYDREFLHFNNYYCFNHILNDYYFHNWNGCEIDNLKDDTLILFFRLVIFSCTRARYYNNINTNLDKIRCKSDIMEAIENISKLRANTDRLTNLFIIASKEILPDDIVYDIRCKIMELKLKRNE